MRAIFLTLASAVLLAGCASAGRDTYATAEGYERMSLEKSFPARHRIARAVCAESGLSEGTRRFARCLANYNALDAAMLGAHARELRDRAARRHGLCIDPDSFKVERCLAI